MTTRKPRQKPQTTTEPVTEAANENHPTSPSVNQTASSTEAPPVEVLNELMDAGQPEPEPGPDHDAPEPDQDASGGGDPGLMDRGAFAELIGAVLGMTGAVAGLQTLQASPRLETFRPACDEFYAVCLKTPSLRFLVEPENETVRAVVVIGAWAVPVARGCTEEIRAKRARVVNPEPEAANDEPESEPEANAA